MKHWAWVLAVGGLLVAGCAAVGPEGRAQVAGEEGDRRQLVTGRWIAATRPGVEGDGGVGEGMVVEGEAQARYSAGSMPVAVGVSPGRKYAVVAGQGYRPALTVIEVGTGRRVSQLEVPRRQGDRSFGLYHGLVVGADSVVYAARGSHATVGLYQLSAEGKLSEAGEVKGRPGDMFAGVAVDGRGRLFVTSNCPEVPTGPIDAPGALVAFDLASKTEAGRVEFASVAGTTNFPLAVAVSRDGSRAYVASERDSAVYVVDTTDARAMKVIGKIAVGKNPAALLYDETGASEGAGSGRLFVTNAGSDTLSIVDVGRMKVTATVLLRPTAVRDLPSVSPQGMSMTPDGRTLFVACGELNAVAVVDVEDREVEGFIPAGWYPTAVATDGKRLVTANGKGTTTRYPKPAGRNYSPLSVIEGDALVGKVPTKAALKRLTEKTLEMAHVTPADMRLGNPLKHVGVEHVIYVIKENRTYDQVLGDLPQGNGDPSYVMFGRDVTPNLHALAERFVLMDNFYDSGDVSGDGWVWSTQAMANSYVTRNVPYSYSGRGREYDYEGSNNGYPTGGFPAKGPDGKPLSEHPQFRNGAPAVPDVAYSPTGALWDLCKANGKTYRNYGMFLTAAGVIRAAEGSDRPTTTVVPDNYPSTPALQPPGHDLEGISNYDYKRYDTDYADSDAPEIYFKEAGDARFRYGTHAYGKHQSPSRISEWRREFELMLKKDPTGGAVPAMMFLRLGNDHTAGMRAGGKSPRAMVADNDYAVGQLVEAVSRSPIWGKTAIFILEDDAQNGPDHVDMHRSICFVVSPWVRRGTVESAFHNTVSCIRTMELLLGLPPMNANDAAARPMLFFGDKPDNAEPYKAILPDRAIIGERNPQRSASLDPRTLKLIEASEAMDLTNPDRAPAEELNRILWASVHGHDRPMPLTPSNPLNAGAHKNKDPDD